MDQDIAGLDIPTGTAHNKLLKLNIPTKTSRTICEEKEIMRIHSSSPLKTTVIIKQLNIL